MDTRITTALPHELQRGDRVTLHTADEHDWPCYVVNITADTFTIDVVSPQVWLAGWLLEWLLVLEGVALAVVAAALWLLN